ncbi:MAG: translocation/assembly module TamB [Schleiferiaceae bacterium]|nr:translocation/assembly module TamB [Schleiferiaceae bacterium]
MVIFIILSTFILSMESVQTYLANVAVNYLNEEFGLDAHIGKIRISFPRNIELQDVYLADGHQDTLIYAGYISTHNIGYNANKNLLKTGTVELNNGKIYLRKYPEDSVFNFKNFLVKLSGDGPKEQSANPFQWKTPKVEVDSMRFIKHRLGCEDSCTNIFLDYSKICVNDFHLNDGYVKADIQSFTFVDRYRTDLKHFSAKAAYQEKYIEAYDLEVETEQTKFRGDVRLDYSSDEVLEYFEDSVQITADVYQADVSSDEFRSWLSSFPDFGMMHASAKGTGTVNDLHCVDVNARMGKRTHFIGDVDIKNSTRADSIFIRATNMDFAGTVEDYNRYITPLAGYELPKQLRALEKIELKGSYIGDLINIAIEGDINTALGGGFMDVDLSNVDNPDNLGYKGEVDFRDFEIGKLLENQTLGKTSFDGKINGSGTVAKYLDFEMDSLHVTYLDVSGYRLQNSVVTGRTKDRIFNGSLKVKDPNLKLDFDGLVDFQHANKVFDFYAHLKEADLYKLGLSKDTVSITSGKLSSNLTYKNLNDFKGDLILFDATYEDKSDFYFFDSLTVNSEYKEQRHIVQLNSQLLELKLDGQFDMMELIPSFERVASSLYKFYPVEETEKEYNLSCSYEVNLNNTHLLSTLFVPGLHLEPGTHIDGHIEMPNQLFSLNLNSPLIEYNSLSMSGIGLRVKDSLSNGNIDLEVKHLESDKITSDSNRVVLDVFQDSVSFRIMARVQDSIENHIKVVGNSTSENENEYQLSLSKTTFNIGLQDFALVGNNKITWTKDMVVIDNIFVQSEESNLAINGTLSDKRYEILRFSSDSLNMNILNYFIGNPNTRISGVMNGDIMLSEVFGEPKILSDFRADSLLVNDDWVGDVRIESNWDYERELFQFTADIERGKLPSFSVDGIFKPDSNAYISADANFNRFRVSALNPLVDGVLSDLRGTITGDIKISGPLSKPHFTGGLTLSQVAMKVPFLQTEYNIVGQPTVEIRDTAFILGKTEIRDVTENTKGYVSGSVNHKAFDNFIFDLTVEADKLLGMDLKRGDYDYFFGKGYASGFMTIKGPVEEIDLELNLRTERGTEFNMPITSDIEVERSNFITFVNTESVYTEILQDRLTELDLRGMKLTINVEATNDAEVRLIMDETVGDIISGSGNGLVKIEMAPNGDITMYGDYTLEKGDYLFTMRSIINKPFVLEPGGTFHWSGDPYNADVNLRAKYTTRTTLTGIVTSGGYSDERVTVDLFLILKGDLMNPTISFEIDLPGAQSSWQEELRNKLTDVDKLNQQAFSLLVLNRFWVDEINDENLAGQGIQANSIQMLSNQFSNWINSGTGDFVDVNMNYNTATQAGYQDEVEIGVSKNFYDDRITVSGILDVPVGSTNNTTNTQTLAGDFEVKYKITEDGRVQGKAFNRNNQNNPARDQLANYTQGLGILYQRDFNTWGDFVRFFFGGGKKEEEPKVNEP